jgi:hypothetical protein
MTAINKMADELFERRALEALKRELGADGLALFPGLSKLLDTEGSCGTYPGATHQFEKRQLHNLQCLLRNRVGQTVRGFNREPKVQNVVSKRKFGYTNN